MAKTQWNFWVIELDSTYRKVGSSRASWPDKPFHKLAQKLGYTEWHRDSTVVGGYYVEPTTRAGLVCYPVALKVKSVYDLV